MNWIPVAVSIGKTVGQVLISLLMSLLTGRAFKRLLLIPLEKWTKRTKTKKDDQVVEEAKKDWGMQ